MRCNIGRSAEIYLLIWVGGTGVWNFTKIPYVLAHASVPIYLTLQYGIGGKNRSVPRAWIRRVLFPYCAEATEKNFYDADKGLTALDAYPSLVLFSPLVHIDQP